MLRFKPISLAAVVCLLGCAHSSPKLSDHPPPKIDVADPTKLTDQSYPPGVTALMVAARRGDLGTIRLLLAAKANPSLADAQGSTALHYAALGSQAKAIELLLQAHASVDAKDGFDQSPLMLATRFADASTIKTLLKGKANPRLADNNGWTALFYAVPRGDQQVFDLIADATGEFSDQDSDGDGLVATAVQYKQMQLLKTILELRAPTDIPNKKGVTPMQAAIEAGNVEAVRMLCQATSTNEFLPDGRTPLMLAIDLRQKDIAGLLFSMNADVRIKDKQGKSSLDHLSEAGLDSDWLSSRVP